MFENPRRGRQARNFTTNAPKILDLKQSSKQIFSENWRWVPLRHFFMFAHWSVMTERSIALILYAKKLVWVLSGIYSKDYTTTWEISAIGHFRVPKTLTFKMRLGAQPFLWKWVLFAWESKMISILEIKLKWNTIAVSQNRPFSSSPEPLFWNRGPGELGNGLFWLTAMVFQFNLKYLRVKITKLLRVVV